MHETALTNGAHAHQAHGANWSAEYSAVALRSDSLVNASSCRDALAALPSDARFRSRLAQRLALAAERQRPLAVLAILLEAGPASDQAQASGAGRRAVLHDAFASRLVRALRPGTLLSFAPPASSQPVSASAASGSSWSGPAGPGTFRCVLEDVPLAAELNARLGALQRALSQPLQEAGHDQALRLHIGVALCPNDGRTADELCRRALVAARRGATLELDLAYFGTAED